MYVDVLKASSSLWCGASRRQLYMQANGHCGRSRQIVWRRGELDTGRGCLVQCCHWQIRSRWHWRRGRQRVSAFYNWAESELVVMSSCKCIYLQTYFRSLFRRHTLSKRRVVPLARWRANPDTDPEALFPKHTVSMQLSGFLNALTEHVNKVTFVYFDVWFFQLVLALYPQTTCFYRALIHKIPTGVRLRTF